MITFDNSAIRNSGKTVSSQEMKFKKNPELETFPLQKYEAKCPSSNLSFGAIVLSLIKEETLGSGETGLLSKFCTLGEATADFIHCSWLITVAARSAHF